MVDNRTEKTVSGDLDHTWLLEGYETAFDQREGLHYRDLIEVSDSLMAGYARFVRLGLPGEVIGAAMLGATVNFYDIFGNRASLPNLLRSLADRIEQTGNS